LVEAGFAFDGEAENQKMERQKTCEQHARQAVYDRHAP
jgi:hypothetical protein